MLYTGAIVMLFVVAIPTAVGGALFARSCSKRGVSRGTAGAAFVLNVGLGLTTFVLAVTIATGLSAHSPQLALLARVLVYLVPLCAIVSIVLDVVLITARLNAMREASRASS